MAIVCILMKAVFRERGRFTFFLALLIGMNHEQTITTNFTSSARLLYVHLLCVRLYINR